MPGGISGQEGMNVKSQQWTKRDYIKDRTQYWMESGLTKILAVQCAEEDWGRYCEKYGFEAD